MFSFSSPDSRFGPIDKYYPSKLLQHPLLNPEDFLRFRHLPAALHQYCNLPYEWVSGDEGSLSASDFELLAVALVTRHGARSALQPVLPVHSFVPPGSSARSFPEIAVDCDMSAPYLRHYRYPPLEPFVARTRDVLRAAHIRFLSTANKSAIGSNLIERLDVNLLLPETQSICENGYLTSLGVSQLILLGEHLGNVYLQRWGLVRPQQVAALSLNARSPSSTSSLPVSGSDGIYARTSPYPRTYLSARSLLYGFVRAAAGTQLDADEDAIRELHANLPLEISTVATLCKWNSLYAPPDVSSCQCVRETVLRARSYTSLDPFLRFSNSVQQTRTMFSPLFDLPVSLMPDSSVLFDYFLPSICHTLNLSCFYLPKTSSGHSVGATDAEPLHVCLSRVELDALFSAYNEYSKQLVRDRNFRHAAVLAAFPMLHEISQRLLEREFLWRRERRQKEHVAALEFLASDAGVEVPKPKWLRRLLQRDPIYQKLSGGHQRSEEKPAEPELELEPELDRQLDGRVADSDRRPSHGANEDVRSAEAPARFVYYSAHDSTIQDALIALGLIQHAERIPPFAARLVFELWAPRAATAFAGAGVRVLFLGEDVTALLPACQQSLIRVLPEQSLCPLKVIAAALSEQLIDDAFGAKSFSQACSSENF